MNPALSDKNKADIPTPSLMIEINELELDI